MTTFTKATFEAIKESERMNRVLEGTAFWARVQTPKTSEKYGTTAYTIQLGLDEANQKLATSFGLKVKPADKSVPMPYVEVKRKVKVGVDPMDVKPEIVDSMQKEIPSNVLIGNESKVRIKFGTYWYEAQGGGIGAALFKVQVLKLVPYESTGERGFVNDPSGFQATGTDGPVFDE